MSKKQVAIEFLKLASSENVRDGYEKYVHPEFRHHNVHFRGDRASLLQAMEENAGQFPDKVYTALRALEDGDLVAVHGKVEGVFESAWSVIHIFRFSDDKIVEAWEASQEDVGDSPNENGLF
ncbi:MAG: nuclear transport factor 2 family protein [Bacteroidales bacterium]